MFNRSLLTLAGIVTCATLISGCDTFGGFGSWRYPDQDGNYGNYEVHRYPDGNGGYRPVRRRKVVVRPGYHLKDRANPVSHKNRDRNWIKSQNDSEYTIQVRDGSSAATVAKDLHQIPKTRRSAQYRSKRGNNAYGGVYGTYRSREEAEKALAKMPASVRKGAKVKNWRSVKSNVAEGQSKPSYSRPKPATTQ